MYYDSKHYDVCNHDYDYYFLICLNDLFLFFLGIKIIERFKERFENGYAF
jgi:hypothetical protein